MPDAARIAQAQALEIPLILQGAKTVEGTDRRELFKENATTTLVFDNGAVLNLRCKLVVGQVVFIHNEQNGREILSTVVEAPPENEAGFTHLEFTTADPDFWNTGAIRTPASAQDLASAAGSSETSSQTTAPAEDTLAMMGETASTIHLPSMVPPGKESGGPLREELVPAHEMVPDSSNAPSVPVPDFEPAVTPESRPSEPTGEQIDAALRQMSSAARAAIPQHGGEPEPETDQKHLAALMERDARLAKFVAFKEKQAEKLQRDAAAKDAGKGAPAGASDAEFASEPEPVRANRSLSEKLTTGRNATYVTIGAAVVIAVLLFFIWHAMRGVFIEPSEVPVTTSTPKGKPTAAPAPTLEASPAIAATIPPAATASVRAPKPVVVPTPKSGPAERDHGESRTASNRHEATDTGVATSAARRQADEDAVEIVRARVLSQPQPTLPPWAVGLQVDGRVTIDVTVDENGNVAETKVLSGPRALQREAERALGLWQFAPALSGGKPISSHLSVGVEFLPPPPPKDP